VLGLDYNQGVHQDDHTQTEEVLGIEELVHTAEGLVVGIEEQLVHTAEGLVVGIEEQLVHTAEGLVVGIEELVHTAEGYCT
jgi:hypothetical protein